MNIVDRKLAYEKAKSLLHLAIAYDFDEDAIERQMQVVSARKAALEQVESEAA